MRFYRTAIVTYLAGVLALAAAGCGNKGDGTPSNTATIGGVAGDKNQPGKTSADRSARDPLHPVVVMETSLGTITIHLDAEKAPLTVENFLSYAASGYYDQTIFHQVFKGQGILGGGYKPDLTEKPARTSIRNEADNGQKNCRGTIAMVRSADTIDSARSQFFFNVADNESLDHKDRTPEGYGYCVFGQATPESLGVLDKIASVPVEDSPQLERKPVQTVLIKSVRVLR